MGNTRIFDHPVYKECRIAVSYILKRRAPATQRAKAYIRKHGNLAISIISYYEVLRGLKYVKAKRQLKTFEEFVKTNVIYPLDMKACRIAADIQVTLRRIGRLIEDAYFIIAAIALANDCVLGARDK